MKVLFIITGSIAVSKCYEILDKLKKNKVGVNCIITNNAKKLINVNKLKKLTLILSSTRHVYIFNYEERPPR